MGYLNHLTVLDQTVREHPNNVAFKIPGQNGLGWEDISYKVFWDDITRFATHWLNKLGSKGDNADSKREVVGLWMFGKTYVDAVHLFSLQRAGFVPHLVSTYLKDVALVQDLFEQSQPKVIICDTKDANGWQKLAERYEVIPMLTLDETLSGDASQFHLPPLDGDGDDILSMEQSSGSSSGRPKVVQFSRRWVDANAQKCQIDERRTPVFIRSGTFCYVGQALHSLRTFLYADCMVMTPKVMWKHPDDLTNIISECGVTDIALYPGLIDDIIQKAQNSPNLTEKLRKLRSLTYGGGPLNECAIEWAKEMGIPIVARFASTEVGMIFVSQPGTPHLLRFYRKFDYKFVPIPGEDSSSKVQELVILPTSPDCPPAALRNPKDGMYYTKDLFERVENGDTGVEEVYVFRGRRDDIIIMEGADNCDAKYLEDRIAYLCHGLVSSFVVVGSGRPSPALLVEPTLELQNTDADNHAHDQTSFHNLLASRLKPLISGKDGSNLFPHELIKPELIAILPKGSLPISSLKGTVMRSKAEEKFKGLLDKLYTDAVQL